MYFPQVGFTRDKADEPAPRSADSGPANFLTPWNLLLAVAVIPRTAPRRAVELGKRRPRV